MDRKELRRTIGNVDYCTKCAPGVSCATNHEIWGDLPAREAVIVVDGKEVRYVLRQPVKGCMYFEIPYNMTVDGVKSTGVKIT